MDDGRRPRQVGPTLKRSIDELISSRRMTRRFSLDPLDIDDVISVLDLARHAPSAGFAQGTSFLVLVDDERDRFWSVSGAGAWFAERSPGVLDAPVLIVPLADQRQYVARYGEPDKDGHGLSTEDGWTVPHWLTDTALAVQQLLLLAEDRGWGALYAGIFRNIDAVCSEFGVPAGVTPLGFVALGHRRHDDSASGSATRRERRAVTDVVHRGRWGA
jgi:nitroreductase